MHVKFILSGFVMTSGMNRLVTKKGRRAFAANMATLRDALWRGESPAQARAGADGS